MSDDLIEYISTTKVRSGLPKLWRYYSDITIDTNTGIIKKNNLLLENYEEKFASDDEKYIISIIKNTANKAPKRTPCLALSN